MALKFGIFPAEVLGTDEYGFPIYDDREVKEEYFARYHDELVYNGISAKLSSSFQVMESSNMTVAVKPGAIFVNGYFAYDDETCTTTISTANTSARVDRIVMRLDKSNRKISLVVLKGTAGSSTAPTLVRSGDVWDMGLCTVSVGANVTSIKQSNITDTRFDRNICGVVSNYLGDVDTTDLFAQYNYEFKTWFENVKDQLSDTAIGNLQIQIDNKSNKVIGKIEAYAGSAAPADYLMCDGNTFSPITYPALYSVIGTTYGGTTTAPKLPDLRGKVITGYHSGNSNFNTIGKTGGTETITLTTSQIPSHSHQTSTNGSVHAYGGTSTSSGPGQAPGFRTTLNTLTTGATGGSGSHNNLQPYIALNYIILAK